MNLISYTQLLLILVFQNVFALDFGLFKYRGKGVTNSYKLFVIITVKDLLDNLHVGLWSILCVTID